MKVLITKQNKKSFKFWYRQICDKELIFKDRTINTCEFEITTVQFKKLHQLVVADGNNPYAVMSW